MDEKFDINLSVRQTEALDSLESETISELLYGGAKGGGKSVFLCFYAVLYAIWIITICKILKRPKYAYVIGFIGRVRSVDFSKTTLVTWKKFIPSSIYELNEQKKIITLFGKVIYDYGGLDDEENIKKFNSAEYGLIILDQAEEADRDQAAMLRGTQGRASINGVTLPIKTLFSANPGECFLKDDFGITPGTVCPSFRKFIQALPSDNTFIDSKAYIAQLKEAWKHHPEILKAYVEGDWSSTAGGGFLIDRDTCSRLVNLQLPIISNTKRWVSNDPAWLGDKTDEIVAYVFEENRVIDSKFMFNQETTTTAAELVKLARQYGGTAIGIDSIGVGAGVVSDCRALVKNDIDIFAINSSIAPTMTDSQKNKPKPEHLTVHFLNVRAEMYWVAVEELKDNKWILPNDSELIRQLCSIKYEIKNGKIKIEDKKEIKARLGKSPDRADCFVQGIWMKKFVRHKINTENRQFPSTERMWRKIRERGYNR
ncbi:MAG: hypothetical protein WC390_09060 [Sulfurimonas sp.]|jgi:hypothetical protein